MKVVMVGPTYPHRGGIVHYTHSLVNALADLPDTQVELLTFDRLFPKFLYKGSEYSGPEGLPLDSRVAVHRILHYGRPNSWRQARKIIADADVLHIQSWTGFLGPVMTSLAKYARRAGVRSVATLHNVQPHDRKDRVLNRFTKRLLNTVGKAIVHADDLRERCIRNFKLDAQQVVVIPHGIYDGFDKGNWTRKRARSDLSLEDHDIAILCFGTIRPYKGLDLAIDALAQLPEQYKLVIAGECWQEWSDYERQIQSQGLSSRVIAHIGYVADDKVELYFRAADIALFPYREFEGQSGAALTAVGFRIPIVGTRDALRNIGLARHAEGNVESLVSALLQLPPSGAQIERGASWPEIASVTRSIYAASFV